MIAIQVFNTQGKRETDVQMPISLDRKEVSPRIFAQAIRTLLQNWRQGTVGCKSRGEVAFSNKKPWRQKGTGRARVSSLRSPLWRKGGIIFGPQPRVRSLHFNKQHKRYVFNNLFYSMLDKNGIYCLDLETKNAKPSTKISAESLMKMGLGDKKVVLFLSFNDQINYASFRNLPTVNIVFFDQPNAYHLGDTNCWVFLKKDVDLFKDMVAKWN